MFSLFPVVLLASGKPCLFHLSGQSNRCKVLLQDSVPPQDAQILCGLCLTLKGTSRIGLMHDCVTCSKFTTKPHLRELFSNLWHLRVIFMWEFFLSWLLWEFVLDKIYKLYFSKRGLVVKRAGVMSTRIRAIHSVE